MKRAIQIVLLLVIIGLGYAVYRSINEPIEYEEQFQKRTKAVVNRLKLIRDAQVAYKSINGKYTGSFDTLIDFVKNGQLKMLHMEGSLNDSLLAAGMTEKEAISLVSSSAILYTSLLRIPSARTSTPTLSVAYLT